MAEQEIDDPEIDDEIEVMARCFAVLLAQAGGAMVVPRAMTEAVEEMAIIVTTNREQTAYLVRLVTSEQAHQIAAERGLVEKEIGSGDASEERKVTAFTRPSKKEMN